MTDERYKTAFDASMQDVEKVQVQLAEKKKIANTMASLYGVEAPFTDVDVPAASGAVIRADLFANYTAPSEAARAFLKLRDGEKGSATLDAIFEALESGGFVFGSTKNEAKGGLRIALGKDSLARKLPNGTYGLWEWYPNAKRDREKKKTAGGASNGDKDDVPDAQFDEVVDDASTPVPSDAEAGKK